MNDMNWSQLQPPEILELTRRFIFMDDHRPLFLKYAGIKPGHTVVDLGCGTGALARFIAKGMLEPGDQGRVVGIDADQVYIRYATAKAKTEGLENIVSFKVGDVFALPFDNQSIDAVTDHTLLINLQDPDRCIRESLRVLKPGGCLSTCTFLWGYFPPTRLKMPQPQFRELLQTQMTLYRIAKEKIFPNAPIGANDFNVYGIMERFRTAGLEDIQVNALFPIFSPDDSRFIPIRLQWLTDMYRLHQWEIEQYLDKTTLLAEYGLSEQKLREALQLLKERYEYEKDNTTWIFANGIELLISGKKVEK